MAFCMTALISTVALGAEVLGSPMDTAMHNKNQNIWFMLMLVAFLMIFIRKFEWGVCLATILCSASTFLVYMALQEFIILRNPAEAWSQNIMIAGVVCAITLVIAIGVFVGTLQSWLYIPLGILFAPCYIGMEYILFTGIPNLAHGPVTDPGGGILVHLFAAYWGLGIALAIREKRVFDEPMFTSKHSVTFAFLAAMLLFILWPSFVTATMSLEESTSVMANCYMSGFGSMLAAFVTCRLVGKKINPLVYMYAMLAGPVGSSSSLLLTGPWGSLVIGIVAGSLSALAFTYLQPLMSKKLGVVDVMGVHQLHGVGGWVSLVGGAILVGSGINILAGFATVVWGIITGLIAGYVIKVMRGHMEVIFSDEAEFDGHCPDPNPEVADTSKANVYGLNTES